MLTNTTKGAEKTLHDQALILDLAKDSIFIRDTEDRITYWNQGAQRLYGWSKEVLSGTSAMPCLKRSTRNRSTTSTRKFSLQGIGKANWCKLAAMARW